MSVTFVVNFRAAEGHADELGQLLAEGRDISRRADGCESFELYRHQEDGNRFVFFERWTSPEAHERNMADNIVASGHLAKLLPFLAGPPDAGFVDLM